MNWKALVEKAVAMPWKAAAFLWKSVIYWFLPVLIALGTLAWIHQEPEAGKNFLLTLSVKTKTILSVFLLMAAVRFMWRTFYKYKLKPFLDSLWEKLHSNGEKRRYAIMITHAETVAIKPANNTVYVEDRSNIWCGSYDEGEKLFNLRFVPQPEGKETMSVEAEGDSHSAKLFTWDLTADPPVSPDAIGGTNVKFT